MPLLDDGDFASCATTDRLAIVFGTHFKDETLLVFATLKALMELMLLQLVQDYAGRNEALK